MDRRARSDPKEAVGGMWEVIGPFQLRYLRRAGLQPENSLLDIGCGSLRGGLHLIRYLQPGRYTGTDISSELLKAGRQFIDEEGLTAKGPHLHRVRDFRFQALAGQKFDFIQAFGVFTDIPKGLVDECFAHLPALMNSHSVFYATFANSPAYRPNPAAKSFWYPWPMLKEMAESHGLVVNLVDNFSATHPKGHSMIAVRPPGSSPSTDSGTERGDAADRPGA
jgi:SAM-dependent methyltransferase